MLYELHTELKDGITAAYKHVELKNLRRQCRRQCVGGCCRGCGHTRKSPHPLIPNDKIDSLVRLAYSLRYFSGRSTYDVSTKYSVSHTEMMGSGWCMFKAVNEVKEWYITNPLDDQVQ